MKCLLPLIILAFSLSASGQVKYTLRVRMTASSNNPVFQKALRNALNRELATHQELSLVEEGGYWLDVKTTEIKSGTKSLGYALSATITGSRHGRPLIATPDNKDEIENYDELMYHDVVIINAANVNTIAKNIINKFSELIDPFR